MIVKPTVSFLNRETDSQLIFSVRVIITSLTGNPDYPAPSPSLPVMQAAADDFQSAIAAAADGGKALTSQKNQKRKALVVLVRALACYVQATCNGDYTVLLRSGFPAHKSRAPIGILTAPSKLRVFLGSLTGQLDGSVAPLFGALTYNWRLTTAAQPDVVLQTKQTSAARVTFSGLTPGVIYSLQANGVGSAGPGPWIGPAARMVV